MVVWLVVTAVRGNGSNKAVHDSESPTLSAERILAERYALGEIDTDDYHHRLEDLRRRLDLASRHGSVSRGARRRAC